MRAKSEKRERELQKKKGEVQTQGKKKARTKIPPILGANRNIGMKDAGPKSVGKRRCGVG